MGYWNRGDLEDAMSPATVVAIFDDAGAGDGSINESALVALIERCDDEVNSWIATNYPRLTLPADPVPVPLKFASLELGIVYSRDRKPEYWSKSQDRERECRLKEAHAKLDRFATSKQFIYDTPDSANNKTDFGAVVAQGAARRGW